jgi:hypothetical protein
MYLSAWVSGTQSVDFLYLGTIIDALPLLLAGPLVEHDAGRLKKKMSKADLFGRYVLRGL